MDVKLLSFGQQSQPFIKPVLSKQNLASSSVVPQTKSINVVPLFGSNGIGNPRHIAPMVIEGAPKFDANKPEVVRYYLELVEQAKTFARPTVSGRQVGVVGIGESGRVYLGTNVEIKGAGPTEVIHGEPFTLTLAKQFGEKKMERMLLSYQPCASCRGIIRELGDENLKLNFIETDPNDVHNSALSKRFTQDTIGNLYEHAHTYATPETNFLKHEQNNLSATYIIPKLNAHQQKALDAANNTYLPNPRKTWAGVAVKLRDGQELSGSAITVSGPNPTISPMQNILVQLTSQNIDFDLIDRVTLVEPKDADYSFFAQTRGIIEALAPSARLNRIQLEEKL